MIEGSTVLVTGAGGSIGGELARQVHSLKPERLVLLDRDESLLQSMQIELEGSGLLDNDEVALACIRDSSQLHRIFDEVRPDVVFHAAALKHLPLLERYPHEAVLTNVLGTRNVMEAAMRAKVDVFVNVSTDKAADPTSVLGASKRVAELIARSYSNDIPQISSVRFGNVLGSRGSFLPLLVDRVASGAPVHLTHPDVKRFFMTIPEAAYLVINAATLGSDGDVFVLDMGNPVMLLELIHDYAALVGASTPEIIITGLRPGEKLEEVVFSESEPRSATRHPEIWKTRSADLPAHFNQSITVFESANDLSRADVRALFAEVLVNYRVGLPAAA